MPVPVDFSEVFATYPFICGYVGTGTERRWADLRAAAPVSVKLRASGEGYGFAASDAPMLEVVGRRRGWCWGRCIAARRRPRSWDDAAFELGLAGLWHDGQVARLHTDLFGLQDVYVREIEGTVYFANRIGPLRGLGDDRLTTDWDGWGSSLVFGGFVGDATPFNEIRRLQFGESITYGRQGLVRARTLPSWLMNPGARESSVADVAASLRAVLPSRLSRTRTAVTLSGGWDSRLISAGMVAKHARRPKAWTINPDTGYEDDVELARPVAKALRLEHTVVRSGPRAWFRHRPTTLARVEHQTWLHTWLSPLARRIHKTPAPLLDGLGGDVLINPSFIEGGLYESDDPDARIRALWGNLGSARIANQESLAPQFAERWAESTLTDLRTIGNVWSGHPTEYNLRKLTVRTNRVIAASPLRLFGPETQLILPFMTPEFIRTSLSIPIDEKGMSAFYRELLAAVDPVVGPMPSTNDGRPKRPSTVPRRQTSKMACEYMAESILADPTVVAMLHPSLVNRMTNPDGPDVRRGMPWSVLQWADALAGWRVVNAQFLKD